jgi:hypothetical protein
VEEVVDLQQPLMLEVQEELVVTEIHIQQKRLVVVEVVKQV